MKDIHSKINFIKEQLQGLGYNVLYIGLYGSQNYGLDDVDSDIDVKAVVQPTLSTVIRRGVISEKITSPYGDIDVKDVLTFSNIISKGNFSYIESLHTEYSYDTGKLDFLKTARVNLRSVKGAMYEKRKALSHPYPSKVDVIEELGYDPKQISQIRRLMEVLELELEGNDTHGFFKYPDSRVAREIEIKREGFPHFTSERVHEAADNHLALADAWLPSGGEYVYEPIDFSDKVVSLITEGIREEILNG